MARSALGASDPQANDRRTSRNSRGRGRIHGTVQEDCLDTDVDPGCRSARP